MQQSPIQNWAEQLSARGPGQEAALAELRLLLVERLRRVFRSNARVDETFIEDTVQDALVKILSSVDQFQGRSKFTTWATTIAIRTALAEMRRMRWRETSLDQLLQNRTTELASPIDTSTAEHDMRKSQFVTEMYQVIQTQLTTKQRTALLAELQGMPLEEIGRRMGSNRNAMYKLTHDARKRLKQGLESAGYSAMDLETFRRNAL